LHELNGVICWLTLAIGGHDKDGNAIIWELIEILKVVFFGIAYERSETKFGFSLFGETDGVFFSCSCLRAVKDYKALFLMGFAVK
jgi:hypothetical protein